VQRFQRCIGSNGGISTSLRCYFHSAAVKVMALLTLPTAGQAYPRGWQQQFCAALLGGNRWWGKRHQRTAVPLLDTAVPVFSSAAKNRLWKRNLLHHISIKL